MKRNCSLTPRQLGLFYLSMLAVSLAIAVFFVFQGAWVVLPFAGLEMLALGGALLVYARHALDYERVRFGERRLVVERMDAGRLRRFEFNPSWVRVGQGRDPGGMVRLRSGGDSVELGRFLMPHLRAGFTHELGSVLLQKKFGD